LRGHLRVVTQVFDWRDKIDDDELNEVADILRDGGIVVFPTETVYGIGANAFNEESVKRIYEVKNRPDEKPLSIMVSKIEEIEKYAVIQNEMERKIINNFMPGPITVILKKKTGMFDYVSSGKNTIGIRIPDNKIALKMLDRLQLPIVAPSANISGMPSGVELEQILKDFDGKIEAGINGGKATIGEGSTIVEIINDEPVILRQGKITMAEIQQAIRKEI
jgi:L-threonylcarbamoyladenylate synthase